ncbi:hypothetical protein, partial [Aquicoccus sp.]|uniref:hypothetical protein n=1 Tax=Aquicoccus sp. TaxID=2055851 RepID=UPI00356A4563
VGNCKFLFPAREGDRGKRAISTRTVTKVETMRRHAPGNAKSGDNAIVKLLFQPDFRHNLIPIPASE